MNIYSSVVLIVAWNFSKEKIILLRINLEIVDCGQNFFYKIQQSLDDMFRKLGKNRIGNSLVVQWLSLCTFTAMGPGSITGREAKIL